MAVFHNEALCNYDRLIVWFVKYYNFDLLLYDS
jgi:hypothetical protein